MVPVQPMLQNELRERVLKSRTFLFPKRQNHQPGHLDRGKESRIAPIAHFTVA